MNAQCNFFASGPAEISGNILSTNTGDLGAANNPYRNLYLTGTGYVDKFSSRSIEATTGQITGLSVSNLYPVGQPNLGQPTQRWSNLYATGTGYIDRIETNSLYSNSGSFNYLGPTGKFFPPLLTFDQRTGYFTGYVTGAITAFDGSMVFQIGSSGEKLMIVQSGVWKTVTLS